jgi:hypothetical protein
MAHRVLAVVTDPLADDTPIDEIRRSAEGPGVEVRIVEAGASDPVLAAADALRDAPADEVLIVNNAENRARWFEIGLFDRAGAMLEAPLRLVEVQEREDGPRVVAVESAGLGIS